MNRQERDLLQRVHDAGITLAVEGERLRYTAPVGVLTPDLRTALVKIKPTILYEYHERAGILEYDARQPRDAAEASASEILKGGTP